MIRARSRVFSPVKNAWLATCIGTLVVVIGTARKTRRGFESQAQMIFPMNSGDPGHSGLSGFKLKESGIDIRLEW